MIFRKGVSPLISVMLILVFTVSISTVTLNWVTDYTKTTTQAATETATGSKGITYCANSNVDISNVVLKNQQIAANTSVSSGTTNYFDLNSVSGTSIITFTGVAGSSYTDNLAGWWHFDGDASDSSGNGNTGTISGASYNSSGYFSDALQFDGDDSVTVADSATLDMTDTITLAAWVNVGGEPIHIVDGNQWLSRLPIQVNSTESLTEYQLKIDNTAFNFPSTVWNNIAIDGTGTPIINITDASGNVLSFWSEKWTANDNFTFYVKGNLSVENTTWWLYFENITQSSSGSNYFNTFDVLGDGSDGALTVSVANTIINKYTYLTGNESSGENSIVVNDGSDFSNGDEILLIQMQNVDGVGVGQYEYKTIVSGGGTTSLTFDDGLKNNYVSGYFNQLNPNASLVTQIVKVSHYTDVTVNTGASIIAKTWDGYSGGIIIFKANGSVTVNGTIDVSAKGYRGALKDSQKTGENIAAYQFYGTNHDPHYGGGGAAWGSCAGQHRTGGGGGYGTVGSDGITICNAGKGGLSYGVANLSQIYMGSGGGGGGVNGGGGINGGSGGTAGGIILIYANDIVNDGSILSDGVQGVYYTDYGEIKTGGGGSGGSIYIQSKEILNAGIISALGAPTYQSGGAGGVGRIRLSSDSISGISNPVAYTDGFDTEHNIKYSTNLPILGIGVSESVTTKSIISKSGAYSLGANTTHAFATINDQTISATINAGWNHLALTYDKNAGGTEEMKLYINGAEQTTKDYATQIITNINDIIIGNNFNGTIDEIRIYNKTLSSSEITDTFDTIILNTITTNPKASINGNANITHTGTLTNGQTASLEIPSYNFTIGQNNITIYTDAGVVNYEISMNGLSAIVSNTGMNEATVKQVIVFKTDGSNCVLKSDETTFDVGDVFSVSGCPMACVEFLSIKAYTDCTGVFGEFSRRPSGC